ncbi:permease [Actibacterium lipolyticum]|uniref:Putative permease n=1 Tax=Actibacterium lipolyticum TaxID=1524263 RepID=A0A238JW43_9RHOB|nr:permease [Actibacterium lipolyticum]SMX34384.1 putative permease [Actibacterium lipolyticum]
MQTESPPPGSSTPRKLIDGSLIFITLIAVIAGVAVWIQKGSARFWEIFAHETWFTIALTPKILAGVFIASSLPFLISRERIQALIGPDSGLRGLAIATLAGVIIPGGPSVTFPLTIGLMTAGADLGAGVALVSGWVLIGLNRTLIWELSFLPPEVVALRVALSLPAPIIMGWAVRRFMNRGAQ